MITFHRHTGLDTALIAAFRAGYSTPEGATVWTGEAPSGETAVVFLAQDGHGLILLTRDPSGYVELSKAMSEGHFGVAGEDGAMNSYPDEWELEPGAVDVSGDSFDIRDWREPLASRIIELRRRFAPSATPVAAPVITARPPVSEATPPPEPAVGEWWARPWPDLVPRQVWTAPTKCALLGIARRWVSWDMGGDGRMHMEYHPQEECTPGQRHVVERLFIRVAVEATGEECVIMVGRAAGNEIERVAPHQGATFTIQRTGDGTKTRHRVW